MKKYCSECGRPLADSNADVCDKCGRRTAPVDFFSRLESDEVLTAKERKLSGHIGLLSVISCAVSFFQLLTLTIILGKTGSVISASLRSFHHWSVTAESRLWLRMVNIIVPILVILIIEQAVSLFFGAMILRKKTWALQVSRVLYVINLVLYIITVNPVSAVIVICIMVRLKGVISRLEGDGEYSLLRRETDRRSAELAADPTKWKCVKCGYINAAAVSECGSCGRRK